MSKHSIKTSYVLASLLAGMLYSNTILAEKPSWAGRDGGDSPRGEQYKRDGGDKYDRNHAGYRDRGSSISVEIHIGDRERTVVRDYYQERFRSGHCPPGLAKKHNGCQPPGQAKRWRVGYPLPRDVIYYDLPPRLVVQLGAPPPRHRYVRVAADILLIAIGTGMVVDAIEDLGNM